MLKFIGINSNTISVNKSGPKQYNITHGIAADYIEKKKKTSQRKMEPVVINQQKIGTDPANR